MNGTAELLQHDFQRRVLGKLDHEHAGLHTDVARVWGTYRENTGPALEGWAGISGRPGGPLPWGGAEGSGKKADTELPVHSTGIRLLTCEGI